MFLRKKKREKDLFQEELKALSLLTIPSDTTVAGNINTAHSMRLDGNIDGDVTSSGKVVIGDNGKLNGELRCKEALIFGTVNGDILVEGLVEIRETAQIKGNITAVQIAMDAGVSIDGHHKVLSQETEE